MATMKAQALRERRDAIHATLSDLSYDATDAERNERDSIHFHVAKAFSDLGHGRDDAAAAHMGSAEGILRAITSGVFAA